MVEENTLSFCPNCKHVVSERPELDGRTCGNCGACLIRKGTLRAEALSTDDREEYVGTCAATGIMLPPVLVAMWLNVANPPYRPGLEIPTAYFAFYIWRQVRRLKEAGHARDFLGGVLGITCTVTLSVLPAVMLGKYGWPANHSSISEQIMLFVVIALAACGCVAAVYYLANRFNQTLLKSQRNCWVLAPLDRTRHTNNR